MPRSAWLPGQGAFFVCISSLLMSALLPVASAAPLPQTASAKVGGVTPQQAAVVAKKQKSPPASKAATKLDPPEPVVIAPEVLQQLPPNTAQTLTLQAQQLGQRHQAIEQAVADDQELVITDLTYLWQAAVERSAAIRYAVEKLSQRDASGKSVKNDGATRRLLSTIAQLGGAAGSMWTGTPIGLFSGSMVSQVVSELTPSSGSSGRVSDADMVILAKAVEDLQGHVMTAYYQYRHAQQRNTLAQQAVTDVTKHYVQALAVTQHSNQRNNLEVLLRSAMAGMEQEAHQAEADVAQTRSALALLVGNDVISAMEVQRTAAASHSTGSAG
jgi:hypothetical protein